MVADKINNKFVAKELLPFVWRVRPIGRKITKVDIIGDLVPERLVYVIKSWGSVTPEDMAYYYAVSADSKDEAVNKFIRYCKATHKAYAFVDENRYRVRCYVRLSEKDRFTKYDEGYIENDYFDIKEFNLQDFVVEYMKVM
jgi:hypothetical protein